MAQQWCIARRNRCSWTASLTASRSTRRACVPIRSRRSTTATHRRSSATYMASCPEEASSSFRSTTTTNFQQQIISQTLFVKYLVFALIFLVHATSKRNLHVEQHSLFRNLNKQFELKSPNIIIYRYPVVFWVAMHYHSRSICCEILSAINLMNSHKKAIPCFHELFTHSRLGQILSEQQFL